MTKIAIVGSRGFNDYRALSDFLDTKYDDGKQISVIISGGAKGADTLGERYADEHNIEKVIIKPDWKKYGRSAGFIRNVDIIKSCDVCVAFWDGESKGTEHDIELCKKYGKECHIVYYKRNE